MRQRKAWVYMGYVVFPADRNSSGVHWTSTSRNGGSLKADTKQGMRELIRADLGKK